MIDAVTGVSGVHGARVAVGANWLQKFGEVAAESGRDRELAWLAVLYPHQAELSWERSCGSDRFGLTLSWGL